MYARFTDHARAVFHAAFGRRGLFGTPLLRRNPRPEAPEAEVVAALLAGRGMAGARLHSLGVAAVDSDRIVGRDELAKAAADEASWRGVNYVGTEHIVIALARLPGSGLPALGATPEALSEWLDSPPAPPEWAARLGRLWRRLF